LGQSAGTGSNAARTKIPWWKGVKWQKAAGAERKWQEKGKVKGKRMVMYKKEEGINGTQTTVREGRVCVGHRHAVLEK